eukprot:3185092-Prymnesium_polylepis.2
MVSFSGTTAPRLSRSSPTRHSCEAESAVASLASNSTCYVRALCQFHKRRIHNSTPMLGDNKALCVWTCVQEGALIHVMWARVYAPGAWVPVVLLVLLCALFCVPRC